MKTFKTYIILMVCILSTAFYGRAQSGKANWPFSFTVPAGWLAQEDDENIILQHPQIKGVIVINAHYESDARPVMQKLQQGESGEGLQLTIKGRVQKLNKHLLMAEFRGWLQGAPVKALTYSTLSKSGGAYISAMAGVDIFSKRLANAAKKIALGIKHKKMDNKNAARYLTGSWWRWTQYAENSFTLHANGTYSDRSEASSSGNYEDSYGNNTGNWSVGSVDRNMARWTIRGTPYKGQIIITYPDGSSYVKDYEVKMDEGQPSWKEYYFNGKIYSKTK